MDIEKLSPMDLLVLDKRTSGKGRRQAWRLSSVDVGVHTRRMARPHEEYVARKIRNMNVHQLAKLARRLPRRIRKVSRLRERLHKDSKFQEPLNAQTRALNIKQSILTEEGIRRNALALS